MKSKKIYIDVKVKSLVRAINFYNKVLGLKLLIRSKNWASVQGTRGVELHLNTGWGANAGIEFKVEDISTSVKELRLKGVKFTSGIRSYEWGKIVYFNDSEGNKLALVESR